MIGRHNHAPSDPDGGQGCQLFSWGMSSELILRLSLSVPLRWAALMHAQLAAAAPDAKFGAGRNYNNRGHVYKRRLLSEADLMIAQTRQLLMSLPSCTMLYNCRLMLEFSLLLSSVMFTSGCIFLSDYKFGSPRYGWGC